MARQDNIEVPAPFRLAADQRGLGAALRLMQSSSAIESMQGKALVIGVYEQGAVIGFANDPEPFGFRFDTVETFIHKAVDKYVNGGYLYTDTTCWLTLSDSRTYRVKGRSGGSERHIVEDFREMADRRIALIQLPRAQATLRDGKTVKFGDIAAGPTGCPCGSCSAGASPWRGPTSTSWRSSPASSGSRPKTAGARGPSRPSSLFPT